MGNLLFSFFSLGIFSVIPMVIALVAIVDVVRMGASWFWIWVILALIRERMGPRELTDLLTLVEWRFLRREEATTALGFERQASAAVDLAPATSTLLESRPRRPGAPQARGDRGARPGVEAGRLKQILLRQSI